MLAAPSFNELDQIILLHNLKLFQSLMRKWIILLNICLGSYFATAQGTELGILIGGSAYSGDLSPKEFGIYPEDIRLAGGVLARFPVGDFFKIRVGITAGKVSGAERDTVNRPIIRPSFQSSIAEVALIGEFYPLHGTVQPYFFGGVGAYHFNPQAGFDGGWIDLQPLGTEGQGLEGYPGSYKLTQLNIPFGAGIKLVFNDAWALGVEFGWRKLFTDYLDDIGTKGVIYQDVYDGNGPLAAFYSNQVITGPEDPRGKTVYERGGAHLDWYHVGGITLTYFLGGGGDSGLVGGRKFGGRGRGKKVGCPTNF